MDSVEFRGELRYLDTWKSLVDMDGHWAEYVRGVKFGLRRHYYGSDYVPSGGHTLWMNASPWMMRYEHGRDVPCEPKSPGKGSLFNARRMRGMGYRMGLNWGDWPRWENRPLGDDVRHFRKILGWQTWEMGAFCQVSPLDVEDWEGEPPVDVPEVAATQLRRLTSPL